MMVITPKHVGAVLVSILMYILKLFLRQFNCASVGGLKKTLTSMVFLLLGVSLSHSPNKCALFLNPHIPHLQQV
jgi:hypothetical protein